MRNDNRVRVPKQHQEFIQKLIDNDEGTGPFQTQADVLAFAAAIGAQYAQVEPFDEHNEPIRQEVFDRAGYDTLINLLSIHNSEDPIVLANTKEKEGERITIFENYANGGLNWLKNELTGHVDYTDGLLLILKKERSKSDNDDPNDIDITELLE